LSCPDEQTIAFLREQEAGADARRLKVIEGENTKRNELLAEAMLNNAMLKNGITKNW
jgi:hypothetical protein